MSPAPRVIRLSRRGTCELCGAEVESGERAWWTRGRPLVVCLSCRPPDMASNATETTKDAMNPAPSSDDRRAEIRVGIAGDSTMREYQRRHDAREERVRQRWGRLSGLILALTDDPSTTRVWQRGSLGESKLATVLGKLERDDVILLSDRRVPRTRGNIDHLIVAPTGIYVVDAKRYTGEVRVRDLSGLFGRRDLHLFVGRRDCTKLAEAMAWQVAAVRSALNERADLPIIPALCFVDAEWPLFGVAEQFQGVRLDEPRSLRKAVSQAGPLIGEDIIEIAVVLSHQLPPYSDEATADAGGQE